MVPALDILNYGHCNNVCYLWFRLSMVPALDILSYGVCLMFVIYGSGVRHPQFRRLLNCLLQMVPALDILSYGHCYNVCYILFRLSMVPALDILSYGVCLMFVIYGSGVRHPQFRRLLNCLLQMVPALDILSYGHCYNVCYIWFRRQTSLDTAFVKMFVIYDSGVRYPQLRPLL